MNKWLINHIKECDSSNNFIKECKRNHQIDDKTAIMTDFQSNGRGQDKNRWHSENGQNLLCSIYLKLQLKADKHFLITIAVSLAVYDLLESLSCKSKIKWPNDIYINDKKIAGILIENSLMRDEITDTIIGIGININQTKFPAWIPNPVSVKQLTGQITHSNKILDVLLEKIDVYMDMLKQNLADELYHKYIGLLYRYKSWNVFEAKGHAFNGMIRGVMPDGKLIIETEGGQLKNFIFGEIKYLL